jgi:hypothetical protein
LTNGADYVAYPGGSSDHRLGLKNYHERILPVTREGDLVLVNIRNKPGFFARIEDISADLKPDWFQVKMLVLQVPLLVITWILREPYINGEEFTMGGHPVTLTRVVSPEGGTETATSLPEEALTGPAEALAEHEQKTSDTTRPNSDLLQNKVVSLLDRRKKGE